MAADWESFVLLCCQQHVAIGHLAGLWATVQGRSRAISALELRQQPMMCAEAQPHGEGRASDVYSELAELHHAGPMRWMPACRTRAAFIQGGGQTVVGPALQQG
jgi:hypothetical protein